jgi:hypothetical protein
MSRRGVFLETKGSEGLVSEEEEEESSVSWLRIDFVDPLDSGVRRPDPLDASP